jgi:phosphoglucomutase
VAAQSGRALVETPVGFKWFVTGLIDGSLCFGGEESAGASFLRRNGSVWTTDKDGLILGLLAAEITASGHDPAQLYDAVSRDLGTSFYQRIDAAASPEQKKLLSSADAGQFGMTELGGEAIEAVLTHAPGNNQPIGGIKVMARDGWFAARPSGTEDVYKIYAESFRSHEHLEQIRRDAQLAVTRFFERPGNSRASVRV